MMKKKLTLVAAVMMMAIVFAGCSNGYKNGTYKAEAAEYSHGWKDYLVIEVTDGKVAVKEFDSLNETGDKKSLDPDYRGSMEPVSGTYPEKFFPDIISEYEKKGSTEKMDNITGATNSTDSFKTLMGEALAKAKKGETAAQ